jgi:hypothetical protein
MYMYSISINILEKTNTVEADKKSRRMTTSKPTEKADGETDKTDIIHRKTDIFHNKWQRRHELKRGQSYFRLSNNFVWKINCSFLDSSSYRAGIFTESMGARNQGGIGLSYRPARLHRLAEFIPCYRFLGSINV